MSQTDADPVPKENPHALLEEGARSYLEAFTALTVFRREVQSICRKVIEDNLPDYSEALGVPLNRDAIKQFATPEDEFSGSSASLGAEHKISRRRESGVGCISYCNLAWSQERENRRFGCSVSMWFNRREITEQLYAAFRRSTTPLPAGIELATYRNEVYLSRELNSKEMASLGEHLDALMVEWVRLWKEFGGLKALGSEKA
jgi:hypothetical protein